jgi:D-glycero-D-manno-heptose 1,7-bisphosphate phosphatase
MTVESKRPVVFLDRDGTLNEERGYIRNLDDLVLIPGAAKAVRKLNEAGVAAILVSNQSGAARNYYPLSHIEKLHERLQSLLSKEGASLDAVYFCPHLPAPEGIVAELAISCHCRKPQIGLVERAFEEHPDLNRRLSFMVGDKTADLGLANNCGAKCILVETGYGLSLLESKAHLDYKIDYQARSVLEAIDWVLLEISAQSHATGTKQ